MPRIEEYIRSLYRREIYPRELPYEAEMYLEKHSNLDPIRLSDNADEFLQLPQSLLKEPRVFRIK